LRLWTGSTGIPSDLLRWWSLEFHSRFLHRVLVQGGGCIAGFGFGSSDVSGKGLIWLRSSLGRLWIELVDIHVWSLVFYIFLCGLGLVGRILRDSRTVMGWVEGLHFEGGIWYWNL
jgi:hypothetical protein